MAWTMHIDIHPGLLRCKGDLVRRKPNDLSIFVVKSSLIDHQVSLQQGNDKRNTGSCP